MAKTATGGLTRESLGVIILAIAVILGITLLGAFKTTSLIDNTIVDTFIDGLAETHPDLDASALAWLVYKEVIERGAEIYRPLWEHSGGSYGFVSGQLDPRLFTETDIMVEQAREISAIAPNVMVKVPASAQGIDVLRRATAEGIPTNTTTCFTVAQALASVTLSNMRLLTDMGGRAGTSTVPSSYTAMVMRKRESRRQS